MEIQVLILLACAISIVAFDCDDLPSKTWKARRNFHRNTPSKYIKNLMGTFPAHSYELSSLRKLDAKDYKIKEPIPDDFDSRTKWPDCPTISEIQNQGCCGSCWAVSAAGAMSDRLCIHSNATLTDRISDQDLLSCCTECGKGCKGGSPIKAWSYWVHKGIVTGGLYKSGEGCIPYKIPPPPCRAKTPKCVRKCKKSYSKTYEEDLHYGKSNYLVEDHKAIQLEILNNGPVQAAFKVYEDFMHCYNEGVYQHVKGKLLGYHAVRIIGWGVEDDLPYWLIANSWGEDWGEDGYFKILRGQNECNIDNYVFAGLPKYT